MPQTRLTKIEELVLGGLAGLHEYEDDATPAELISAVITIARKVVAATLVQYPEYTNGAREAVEVLLMECADRRKAN